jgi:hypothetical protein
VAASIPQKPLMAHKDSTMRDPNAYVEGMSPRITYAELTAKLAEERKLLARFKRFSSEDMMEALRLRGWGFGVYRDGS